MAVVTVIIRPGSCNQLDTRTATRQRALAFGRVNLKPGVNANQPGLSRISFSKKKPGYARLFCCYCSVNL
jgi:hypothetical protein